LKSAPSGKQMNLAQTLLSKCSECGLDSTTFIQEKISELEERKRILLTPSARWFQDNLTRYNDFASAILQRPLTDEEKYGGDRLVGMVQRRLNPQQPFPVEEPLKRKLLEESNGRCKVCGTPLTVETMRVDHKVPVSEGGSPHPLNLQALCELCNSGKSDYFEETAHAAARPWYERRKDIVMGDISLTPKKRFCVLIRDQSCCRVCGTKALRVALKVMPRVSLQDGGQLVYDNLITVCEQCIQGEPAREMIKVR
jgi:5-methylcytosine-specific restriction endonuclease McrA